MSPSSKPRVTGTTHPLPFGELSPKDFERLTLWLVRREGFEPAQHLGETGNDKGRDIEAWKGGRRFAFQCKRVKAFSAGDGKAEIAKLRRLPLDRQPQEVVFVLYIPVQPDLREALEAVWGDEATCHFWVGNELDERVKRHRDIVAEFFQIDAEPQRIVWLGQTRAPSQNFVGREEDLAALDAKLAESGKVAVQAAITGLAGIGKTELALHYAHYHADPVLFPGGVIWLDASTDLAGQWARLAPRIGVPAGSVEPREIEPVVLSELAGRPRLLLVLDNAESWKALQGHLPIGGTAHAYLVITRGRDFAGAQFQHLPLGILNDESARELLHRLMGDRATERAQEVEALIAALAGHALALEITGAYLRHHRQASTDDLVGNLPHEPGKRVLDEVAYGLDFSVMMDELLGRLAEEDSAAAQLFLLLGLFGSAPAPLSLLRGDWSAVSEEDFGGAFEVLEALHLVDRVGEDGWAAHRLVCGRARARMSMVPDLEEVCRRAQAIKLLSLLWDLDDYDVVGYSALRPHIYAASDWAVDMEEVGYLLAGAQQFPWRFGDAHLARAWAEEALRIHLHHFGVESTEVAIDRSNLATILQDLGDLEGARRQAEEALNIDRKALGDDHPIVATNRSNLATILENLGDFEGAQREVEEALRIDRRILGDDHPNVAAHRSNLAMILKDQRDFEGARREAWEAVRISRKSLGRDHPSIAIRRSNLGGILRYLGDLEGARREALEAVRIALIHPAGSVVREKILEGWQKWLTEDSPRD